MRDRSCPECSRLWREYAVATSAEITLNGQVKQAALSHDSGLSELPAPVSESATQERESLRQQIKDHEASRG